MLFSLSLVFLLYIVLILFCLMQSTLFCFVVARYYRNKLATTPCGFSHRQCQTIHKQQRWRQKQEDLEDYHFKSFLFRHCYSPQGNNKVNLNISNIEFTLLPQGNPALFLKIWVLLELPFIMFPFY